MFLDLKKVESVHVIENSDYQSLKNRSCVTVFGSCSVTLTVGEPLRDVSGSANHDFRTSVTGISGEIDASKKAFDRPTVNHEILINKMDHYGIRGTAKTCFTSFLIKGDQ